MSRQVCVVTGATSGIGLETARGLARQGMHVVLTARSAQKGDAALAAIRASEPDASLEVVLLDLADLSTVRFAGRQLREAHPDIAVLVNNAGVFETARRETVDGFEVTFGVNHLGPYLLTRLLLPSLLEGAASRVVNVSSEAHRGSSGLDFTDLQWRARTFSGFQAYADSKLANLLFTRSLSRRFDPDRLVVHAVHPGAVATGLFREDMPHWMRWGMAVARPFMKTPERGARTSIHAAIHPSAGTMTGGYFADCRIKTPSRGARNDLVAGQLWEQSARMVDIDA